VNGPTHPTKKKPGNNASNAACDAELHNSKSINLDASPTSLDLQKIPWVSFLTEKQILYQIQARNTCHLVTGQNFLVLPQNNITQNRLQFVAHSLLLPCLFRILVSGRVSILPMTRQWHIPARDLVIQA
jgi:hypothetical protein